MYMVVLLRKRIPGVIALIGLTLGFTTGAAEFDSQLPIQLDAASTDVDYRTNRVLFRDITISQGDLKVEADQAEATGLDFENSSWTFWGNVNIQAERRGSMQSERAIVEFRDNRMTKATITGKPARFEQVREGSNKPARGRAGAIEYQVDNGTVRLAEDAWLTDGRTEISGPFLVYNIREQKVRGAAQSGAQDRVHITILPKQGAKPEKKP